MDNIIMKLNVLILETVTNHKYELEFGNRLHNFGADITIMDIDNLILDRHDIYHFCVNVSEKSFTDFNKFIKLRRSIKYQIISISVHHRPVELEDLLIYMIGTPDKNMLEPPRTLQLFWGADYRLGKLSTIDKTIVHIDPKLEDLIDSFKKYMKTHPNLELGTDYIDIYIPASPEPLPIIQVATRGCLIVNMDNILPTEIADNLYNYPAKRSNIDWSNMIAWINKDKSMKMAHKFDYYFTSQKIYQYMCRVITPA